MVAGLLARVAVLAVLEAAALAVHRQVRELQTLAAGAVGKPPQALEQAGPAVLA